MPRPAAEAEGNRAPACRRHCRSAPQGSEGAAAPNTTVLVKSAQEAEDTLDDLEGRETRVVKRRRGRYAAQDPAARRRRHLAGARHDRGGAQHLPRERSSLPDRRCASRWCRRSRSTTARSRRGSASSPTGHDHLVTVTRNAAGEFVASSAVGDRTRSIANAALGDDDQPQTSSLYASLYHAGLLQNVPPDSIMQILQDPRLRDRLPPPRAARRCGRVLLRHEGRGRRPTARPASCSTPRSRAAARPTRFYRFRTPDGVVDYYDEKGNNSKQVPHAPAGARRRRAPHLRLRRALPSAAQRAAACTPASTGPPRPARRSWPPATASSRRPAARASTATTSASATPTATRPPTATCRASRKGVAPGVKVRQGQIIGYVGSTGLVVGSAPALRGAGQQPLRRSDVDPGAARAPADGPAARRVPEGARPHRRPDATARRS